MKLLTNGRVYLQKGETIPYWCHCKTVYQPPAGTMASICPNCASVNIHEEISVDLVRRKGERFDGAT